MRFIAEEEQLRNEMALVRRLQTYQTILGNFKHG